MPKKNIDKTCSMYKLFSQSKFQDTRRYKKIRNTYLR